MKFPLNSRNGWSYALLLSIVIGCKQSGSSDVTPVDPTCQVQTINSVTVENGSTSNSSTTFSYDAKGQLTSVVSSSPGTVSTKVTETYTYDNNGYATAYNYVSLSTLGNQTKSETYSYANGQLSLTTFKTVVQYLGTSSSQTNGSTTYSYDAAGTLTQTVTISTYTYSSIGIPLPSSTTNSTRSYTNGMLTSIKESVDGKASTTYTITNGRIMVEANTDGSKKRYTYNANGYQTKREVSNLINTITSAETTEYDAMPAPKSVYPVQKGFPVIQPSYGKDDRAVSRSTILYSGKVSTDYQFDYQLNSNGYPAQVIKINGVTNGTTTSTYTYANCS